MAEGLQPVDLWTLEAPMGRNIVIEDRGGLGPLEDWADIVVSIGDGEWLQSDRNDRVLSKIKLEPPVEDYSCARFRSGPL